MSNYTSRSQKIDLYAEKYNLPREEIRRILTEYEYTLSLDELKIRYDNPLMGHLPSFLGSFEELDNMIWKTIHRSWSTPLEIEYKTKDDLYMEMLINTYCKSNQFVNHAHLKCSLVNFCLSRQDDSKRHTKHWGPSLDEVNTYNEINSDSKKLRFEPFTEDDMTIEDQEFISKIRSIKDKSVRDLLIVVGYLSCNLIALRKDYLEVLRSADQKVQDNIAQLENQIYKADIKASQAINYKKSPKIKIDDILQALDFRVFKDDNMVKPNGKAYPLCIQDESKKKTLEELKYYLTNVGLISA